MRILVAPGSIGCEALTLGVLAAKNNLAGRHGSLAIHSIDLSEEFTQIAREGLYPKALGQTLPRDARSFFRAAADPDLIEAIPEAVRHITVLPPANLTNFRTDKPYDVVITANLLQHLPSADQQKCMQKICDLSSKFVCCMLPVWHDNVVPDSDNHPFRKSGLKLLNARWTGGHTPGATDFGTSFETTQKIFVFSK